MQKDQKVLDGFNDPISSNAYQLSSDELKLSGDPPLGSQTGQTQTTTYKDANILVFKRSLPHQMFCRSAGGNLGSPNYWQRCLVHILNADVQNGLPGRRIGIFGGGWPAPTPWYATTAKSSLHTYYFGGQYHQEESWRWTGGGIIEEYTPFQNGYKSILYYEDGHNRRYDDHIIEVAFVKVIRFNNIDILGDMKAQIIDRE